MEKIKLSIENINKRYDSRIIFRDFNIDFYVNEVWKNYTLEHNKWDY